MRMTFHESFGTIPDYLLATILRCNVSPADWDTMLMRWGYEWNNPSLPFGKIETHIESHTFKGSYRYPMYGY